MNAMLETKDAGRALDYLYKNKFMGQLQTLAVLDGFRSEEKQFFFDTMVELAKRVKTMPVTGQQEKVKDPIAYLHYFTGNADWWITEKDVDTDGEGQIQAFGFVRMFEEEWGYISIEELTANNVELDFHFTPKPMSEAKK